LRRIWKALIHISDDQREAHLSTPKRCCARAML
jgi:hypothetical protein